MVVHVYEQAQKAHSLGDVIVAIDSEETEASLKEWKVNVVMTSVDHASGTDRIWEAAAETDADVIVNIQGDEPTIDPNIIDKLVHQFEDDSINMATAAGKDMNAEIISDPNTVKVLLDEEGFAVNFRRDPVPNEMGGYYHHLGIYAFRKSTLKKFTGLAPSENELAMKLEQYRALDNGMRIKVILTEKVSKGIDTIDDLKQFERL